MSIDKNKRYMFGSWKRGRVLPPKGFMILFIFGFLVVATLPRLVMAATYHVDVNTGDDSYSGNEDQPFRTINHATGLAQAGDTIRVKPGTYRESITFGNAGSAGSPITLEAYDSEDRPVLNGAVVVASWTGPDGDGVYTKSTSLTGHPNLYYDGVKQRLAIQPISSVVDDIWDNTDWYAVGAGDYGSYGGGTQTLVLDTFFATVDGEAVGDDYWVGAEVLHWSRANTVTGSKTITAYVASTRTATLTYTASTVNYAITNTDTYAVANHPGLIKTDEYAVHDGTIYFQHTGSLSGEVAVSTLTYGVVLDQQYITIDDFVIRDFRNNGIHDDYTADASHFTLTDTWVYRNGDADYQSSGLFIRRSTDTTIIGCEFSYNTGNGIAINDYTGNVLIDGCYIHHNNNNGIICGYGLSAQGVLYACEGVTISNCTIVWQQSNQFHADNLQYSYTNDILVENCYFEVPGTGTLQNIWSSYNGKTTYKNNIFVNGVVGCCAVNNVIFYNNVFKNSIQRFDAYNGSLANNTVVLPISGTWELIKADIQGTKDNVWYALWDDDDPFVVTIRGWTNELLADGAYASLRTAIIDKINAEIEDTGWYADNLTLYAELGDGIAKTTADAIIARGLMNASGVLSEPAVNEEIQTLTRLMLDELCLDKRFTKTPSSYRAHEIIYRNNIIHKSYIAMPAPAETWKNLLWDYFDADYNYIAESNDFRWNMWYVDCGIGANNITSRDDDDILDEVIDYDGQDFHLKSGSSLRDAGINVGIPFVGSAPDIGKIDLGSPDTTAPDIISVTVNSPVYILFSEPLDEASATNISNYSIRYNDDLYLIINSATLQEDLKTVILDTSDHTENVEYTLAVSNVRDVAGNAMGTIQTPYQYSSTAIIIDHTAVEDFDAGIPQFYIDEVKKMLLNYPGESHGRGLLSGLRLVEQQDNRFAVSIRTEDAPEADTDQHLRVHRPEWRGSSWNQWGTGEEDTWTNQAAIDRLNSHFAYARDVLNNPFDAFAFGWCWDMTWHNPPGGGVDPVYGVRWAGSTVGGPDGDLRWGLDADDTALTGNSVSLQNYLDAWVYYEQNNPDMTIAYSTGPVDYTGELGYQAYLKHEKIREWVSNSTDRVLFDYGDIITYNNAGVQNTATWDGHTYPLKHPENAGEDDPFGYGSGHLSNEGYLKIGKAMWVLLAKKAGWDGTTEEPAGYTLNITTNGNGTVTKSPDNATYDSGDVVTLQANPDVGYEFESWSGDFTETSESATITMDSNMNITATFVQSSVTPTPGDITEGLVLHYPYGTAGTVTQDSSSNNNTATLVNGPVWTANGVINGALALDGVDDYVNAGNSTFDLTEGCTVSSWIYVNGDGAQQDQVIIQRGIFAFPFIVTLNNHNLQTCVRTVNGTDWLSSDTSLAWGQWYHIAITYESGSRIIYVNGLSDTIDSTPPTGTLRADTGHDTLVGSWGDNRFFNGSIDEVRIYNRALAASEVAALYDDGNSITSPDVDRVTTPFESIIELWLNDPEPFGGLLTEKPGDYTVNNGINVHKVALDADNNRVRLFTDVHNTGTDYTLNIAGFDTNLNYTYDNGLIGNWKLDDYSGAEAQDSSGNGNTATLQNGPRWTTQGGISLDGGDDAVEIPTTGWDAGSGTLSLWAYAQDLSDTQFFFGHTANSSNRIQLYTVAGNLILGLGDDLTLHTGIETLDTNVWYNLALTWNGTNYSVYVDGIEKAAGAYSGLTTLNSYADIGNYGLASSRDAAFDGLIGDVRMYNRTYSAAEVQDLYLTYQVNENRQLALATTEQLAGDSTITYQLQNPEDLPDGATFNDSDGTVTWRPWYDQAGAFELTFAENGQPENTKTYTVVANNITLKDWYRTWLSNLESNGQLQ